MDAVIPVFKHDVSELLEGTYNKYSDDGALEVSLEDIVLSKEDKEYLAKSKKRKTQLGTINITGKTHVFKRNS